MIGSLGPLFHRQTLADRLNPAANPHSPSLAVPGMITDDERRALAWFAERLWSQGARRDALIVDGGPFVGASTMALAEGLARSPLSEAERRNRIWSYDLFRTTPGM